MHEIKIQTHFIVTGVHDEYHINWTGKIIDIKPKIINGKPIFIIIGGGGRMELNTTDMVRIEKCAKLLTCPKGRGAVSTDTAKIYIVDVNDNEKLMGTLVHDCIKEFVPMYDKVGYEE